jgi:hypothetical protein
MTVTSPRSSGRGFPLAPTYWGAVEEGLRKVAEVVNSLRDGKINSVGTVTLTANSTTTTITDARISPTSKISLTATSATAAATTGLFVTAGTGSAAITHNSTADTNRTFSYAIFG